LGRGCTEGRIEGLKSVGPTCIGDREVGMHACAPAYQIGMHGRIGKGIESMHYVCACRLNRRAHVHACRVNRHTRKRVYVVNRRAHVCTYGVNRRARVHACGVNNHTLEARLTGVKLIFLMLLIVHVADLGWFYVVVGELCAQCQLVGERDIGPSCETPWLLRSQVYV
jgi:hypothetical protein